MLDHAAMDGMGRIRVFRGDEQERTAGDFGPVHESVDSDQSLMYILRVIRVKEKVPKRLIAVVEVRDELAPAVGGVTYELLPEAVPVLGIDAISAELDRIASALAVA